MGRSGAGVWGGTPVGAQGTESRWGVRGVKTPERFCEFERKICPQTLKHEKNAGITTFSRFTLLRKDELRIVRVRSAQVGVRGFLPREIFRNSCPFGANFLVKSR